MQQKRTALVTGAASGIGLAFARLLAQSGHETHLVDINEDALRDAAAEIGQPRSVGDVADPDTMQHLADRVGPVDFLCLNAGVTSTATGAPWAAPHDEWERVLGVNLLGVVNGLRSFVPIMLASEQPGNIIITASLAGAATWPGGGPYAASKHATLAVAEQAALELADTNVGVTVVCPALVRSAMSDTGRDPGDVAAEALVARAAGRFAVLATEWSSAVGRRADMLVSGAQPTVPEPDL